MSLKHKTYLEFLSRIPSSSEIDEYLTGLIPKNKEQFNSLMLFGYFGMEQLAKEKKLIRIGDMYFTLRGLVVMILSASAAMLLNRFVLHFNFWGFAILFALFTLGGWSYLVYYRKHRFYVERTTLWKIILEQYINWINRDSDGFIETFNEYITNIPKKKEPKMLIMVRNQIAR